jgi:hypothetical protein
MWLAPRVVLKNEISLGNKNKYVDTNIIAPIKYDGKTGYPGKYRCCAIRG